MRIPRMVMGVMAVATALSVGVASANSLGTVADSRLGSDSAAVGRCDTDGVTIAFAYSGSNVSSVTVSGIHDNCSGATLSYTLVNASGARVGQSDGTVAVPDGGGSAPALAVAASQPDGSTVKTVKVLLLGGRP